MTEDNSVLTTGSADAEDVTARIVDAVAAETQAPPQAPDQTQVPPETSQDQVRQVTDKEIDADTVQTISGVFYAIAVDADGNISHGADDTGKALISAPTLAGLAELVAACEAIADTDEVMVFQDATAKFTDGTDADNIRIRVLTTTKAKMAEGNFLENLDPGRTLAAIRDFVIAILKVSDLKCVVISMLSESSGLGGFSVMSQDRALDSADATVLVTGMHNHADILRDNLTKAGLSVDDGSSGGIIAPGSAQWSPRT